MPASRLRLFTGNRFRYVRDLLLCKAERYLGRSRRRRHRGGVAPVSLRDRSTGLLCMAEISRLDLWP